MVYYFADFTAFVGANSSGKTAAFAALGKLFSQSPAERIIEKTDFHLAPGEKAEDKEARKLMIEAVFAFDELRTPDQGKMSVPPFFDALIIEAPDGIPHMRIRLEATWTRSGLTDGNIDKKCYYVASSEETEISEKEELRIAVRRAEIEKIKYIFIPAFRDTEHQIRNSGNTLMHQMLQGVNWTDDVRSKVLKCFKTVDSAFSDVEGVRIINEALGTWWSKLAPGGKFSTAKVRFDSGDLEQAVQNSAVYFSPADDDGMSCIDSIGDGHKSLFYISMASSLVDVQERICKTIAESVSNSSIDIEMPALSILAVEEPENHISPHLLGRVAETLRKISRSYCAQAVISSHSASVIGRVQPAEIRYFRHSPQDDGSTVRNITLSTIGLDSGTERFIRCGVKSYPELYFARLVVLCEGESERIVLPKVFEDLTDNSIDAASVSVVPLGGRHVNYFWRLLFDLKIPFVTLLDFDRERSGGAWGRIQYALTQLLENGQPRDKVLLGPHGHVLDDEELRALREKSPDNKEDLQFWCRRLRAYGVYFSYPLDLDWVMLNAFGDKYKELEAGARGPNHKVKIESVIRDVLKKDGGDGKTYTRRERDEMRWYDYLFLGKGKPVTHAMALSRIDAEDCRKHCPKCLKELVAGAKKRLGL